MPKKRAEKGLGEELCPKGDEEGNDTLSLNGLSLRELTGLRRDDELTSGSGEARVLYSKRVAAFKWKDKKDVHLLSAYHKDLEMTKMGKLLFKTKETVAKPNIVMDYNVQMNAVDRQDQQLASFLIMRRYAKGQRKVFFYVKDMLGESSRKNFGGCETTEYRRHGCPTSGPQPMCFQAANWGHFHNRIPLNTVKKNPSRNCEDKALRLGGSLSKSSRLNVLAAEDEDAEVEGKWCCIPPEPCWEQAFGIGFAGTGALGFLSGMAGVLLGQGRGWVGCGCCICADVPPPPVRLRRDGLRIPRRPKSEREGMDCCWPPRCRHTFFYSIIHRENIKSCITYLYGEEIFRSIRSFERLRKKRANLLASLAFLLRCRDNNIIPTFARLRHPIKTAAAQRILHRAGQALKVPGKKEN
ncbi:hypothetical protein J437_LFUL016264 [Ladona fulva]|uniref:PiggyBac transposable element-derived protein domain-containing protein n=1 Tax=Ladona fulva TaxID=123851 RepID=A0A8K0KLW7_LADFU|nr:hypothetical protein J437_LFUL016264 [Ladona fulva]